MKVSARNTFSGTITKVTKGAVNAEVLLTTTGGDQIVASITNGSVETLALKEGVPAVALVKASWVILGKDLDASKISTRNVLSGTINSIRDGAVNSEVEVKLSGGTVLTAIVTIGSVQRMHLAVGEQVSAVFKASSVILAVE
ncbi:MAG: TOBE domain-containing protein [Terracidiphilus sp.]|nr:TOBE domain-containing protein [Terracidiphilus sp.]MDR3776119.1 TOBE domain-containing protein [Terracidiphilus sp.]